MSDRNTSNEKGEEERLQLAYVEHLKRLHDVQIASQQSMYTQYLVQQQRHHHQQQQQQQQQHKQQQQQLGEVQRQANAYRNMLRQSGKSYSYPSPVIANNLTNPMTPAMVASFLSNNPASSSNAILAGSLGHNPFPRNPLAAQLAHQQQFATAVACIRQSLATNLGQPLSSSTSAHTSNNLLTPISTVGNSALSLSKPMPDIASTMSGLASNMPSYSNQLALQIPVQKHSMQLPAVGNSRIYPNPVAPFPMTPSETKCQSDIHDASKPPIPSDLLKREPSNNASSLSTTDSTSSTRVILREPMTDKPICINNSSSTTSQNSFGFPGAMACQPIIPVPRLAGPMIRFPGREISRHQVDNRMLPVLDQLSMSRDNSEHSISSLLVKSDNEVASPCTGPASQGLSAIPAHLQVGHSSQSGCYPMFDVRPIHPVTGKVDSKPFKQLPKSANCKSRPSPSASVSSCHGSAESVESAAASGVPRYAPGADQPGYLDAQGMQTEPFDLSMPTMQKLAHNDDVFSATGSETSIATRDSKLDQMALVEAICQSDVETAQDLTNPTEQHLNDPQLQLQELHHTSLQTIINDTLSESMLKQGHLATGQPVKVSKSNTSNNDIPCRKRMSKYHNETIAERERRLSIGRKNRAQCIKKKTTESELIKSRDERLSTINENTTNKKIDKDEYSEVDDKSLASTSDTVNTNKVKKNEKVKKEKKPKAGQTLVKEKKKPTVEEHTPSYATRSSRSKKESLAEAMKKVELKVRKPRKARASTVASVLAAAKRASKRTAETIEVSKNEVPDIPYPKGLKIIELSNMKQQFVIDNLVNLDGNIYKDMAGTSDVPETEVIDQTPAKKLKIATQKDEKENDYGTPSEIETKMEFKSYLKTEPDQENYPEILDNCEVQESKTGVYDFDMHSDYGKVFDIYENYKQEFPNVNTPGKNKVFEYCNVDYATRVIRDIEVIDRVDVELELKCDLENQRPFNGDFSSYLVFEPELDNSDTDSVSSLNIPSVDNETYVNELTNSTISKLEYFST